MTRLAKWLAGAALFGTTPNVVAQAYECTPAPEASRPTTQVWHRSNRCVPIYVDRASTLFSSEAGLARVADSLAVWMAPACTDLELRAAGVTDQAPGFDPRSDGNRNVISEVIRPEDQGFLPDPSVLATTVTFHAAGTGEIYDADILFNTPVARFTDVASREACLASAEELHDVRNTLIHELGHVLGFDHNADVDSTMFGTAPVCETSKRDLTPTDVRGVCDVYPARKPSRTCLPADDYGSFDRFRNQCDRAGDGGGGCRSAGPSTTLGWALVAVAALFGRQRRVSGR